MDLDANRQKILDMLIMILDADKNHGHWITKQRINKRANALFYVLEHWGIGEAARMYMIDYCKQKYNSYQYADSKAGYGSVIA